MNYNVVELLKGCLHDFKRDDLITDNLDHHSTITIDIEKRPSINITDQDGTVVLWATMTSVDNPHISLEEMLYKVMQASEAILELQLEASYELFSVGQPALCKGKDKLELCAALQPACFESKEAFGAALESFFNHMVKVHDMISIR